MMQKSLKVISVSLFIFNMAWADPSHETNNSPTKTSNRPVVEALENESNGLTARLGDDTSSSSYRQLFIYSGEKLTNVEYSLGDSENWEKMKTFSTPGQFAYGTESFLPTAPGQKFTVRGITTDGKRVTSVLTVDPDKGLVLAVKKIKEEDVKTLPVSATVSTSRVLQLAQSNVGRTVGSGDCSALSGGQRIGSIGGGGAGIENLAPGMVLRLSPNSSLYGSMGRFNVSSMGHYIVVESVNPNGQITFLDQNWMGGSSAGRTVRRATANLRSLNGSATIYSGN